MKKTIKLALTAAMVLSTTSAFATNGSTLIGTGAKSRAMGGVTIGIGHGAESGLSNPALINSIKKDNEISFGGTLFMPSVSADMGAGSSDSAADMSMIPEVAIASKISDDFYVGIGMYGTAGMGVDYRDEAGYTANMNMVTNLQIMQFGVALSYVSNGFSVGLTPILQYGSLDINFNDPSNTQAGYTGTGAGVAQDLSLGYNIGLAYQVSGLTIGAVYKSQIDMFYKGQLSSVTQPFADAGVFPGAMSDLLSTPAEMGIGVSYVAGEHTIAIDYKKINWSDAEGYKEFAWEDQTVMALGYAYATKGWAVRLGYNYASSPISDPGAMTIAGAQAASMNEGNATPSTIMAGMPKYFGGNAANTFNTLGFPATVESHITLGGTYALNEVTSLDLAYVYAPETSTTLQTMPAMDPSNPNDPTKNYDMETTVTHSQSSLSFQLNYAF